MLKHQTCLHGGLPFGIIVSIASLICVAYFHILFPSDPDRLFSLSYNAFFLLPYAAFIILSGVIAVMLWSFFQRRHGLITPINVLTSSALSCFGSIILAGQIGGIPITFSVSGWAEVDFTTSISVGLLGSFIFISDSWPVLLVSYSLAAIGGIALAKSRRGE